MDQTQPSDQQHSFLARHDFLIRRLHSLSGLIPVGAYMVVHLITNASVVNGASTFQGNVYKIHSLGNLLPLVEWVFIFIPILFHAAIGFVIIGGGMPNSTQYRYGSNVRYTLQRATGMIAFVFIMLHVFHMHGWFHEESWVKNVVEPLGGGQFKPYSATSTASEALQSIVLVGLYLLGVLSCVFHLANGLWTMGITWGIWTSEKGQARALKVCTALGLGLAAVSVVALFGIRGATDTPEKLEEVRAMEEEMYDAKVEARELEPNEHKFRKHEEATTEDEASQADSEDASQ
ncbi:succinate dehydrogenase cytochrome b558 subunit [Adhaeretor mobilis]|uniref:Succinate dehydrogenase cytochrome b558 subunit n=1 Tax=Adhaeretor mobilis TaxID=1930276 RepID=A0A517MQG2_9BACT|nr:succinate dehydrogenase cytochrome b558 subunit [Adhaeretor mobilis]QDS97125.1 Succinate dehydrogenase cytochrome b558 subunit [Adhaeretor mobilis]